MPDRRRQLGGAAVLGLAGAGGYGAYRHHTGKRALQGVVASGGRFGTGAKVGVGLAGLTGLAGGVRSLPIFRQAMSRGSAGKMTRNSNAYTFANLQKRYDAKFFAHYDLSDPQNLVNYKKDAGKAHEKLARLVSGRLNRGLSEEDAVRQVSNNLGL